MTNNPQTDPQSITCPTTLYESPEYGAFRPSEGSGRIELEQELEELGPEDVHLCALLLRMRILRRLGRLEEGITQGLRGCHDYPDVSDFFVETAQALVALGRCDQAYALLKSGSPFA